MRMLFVIILSLLFFLSSANANDTDSLTLENTQYIKQRVNYLIKQLNAINSSQNKRYNNIEDLKNDISNDLEKLNLEIKKTGSTTQDSIHLLKNELNKTIDENQKKLNKANSIHYGFHILSVILIVFLVFFIERQRRKSLDYLISKTQYLSGQNTEMLEKAEELNKIKSSLKKMAKEQKKVRKKMKKK